MRSKIKSPAIAENKGLDFNKKLLKKLLKEPIVEPVPFLYDSAFSYEGSETPLPLLFIGEIPTLWNKYVKANKSSKTFVKGMCLTDSKGNLQLLPEVGKGNKTAVIKVVNKELLKPFSKAYFVETLDKDAVAPEEETTEETTETPEGTTEDTTVDNTGTTEPTQEPTQETAPESSTDETTSTDGGKQYKALENGFKQVETKLAGINKEQDKTQKANLIEVVFKNIEKLIGHFQTYISTPEGANNSDATTKLQKLENYKTKLTNANDSVFKAKSDATVKGMSASFGSMEETVNFLNSNHKEEIDQNEELAALFAEFADLKNQNKTV